LQRYQPIPPIKYTMYSPQQVNFMAYCSRSLDLYFDATGGGFSEQKSLLYALVAKIRGTTMNAIPVAETILTKHSSPEISTFLISFIEEVKKLKQGDGAICNTLTMDFSHALINAVSLSFNQETTIEYLKRSYNCMRGLQKFPENKTDIYLQWSSAESFFKEYGP